jgi:hypothetical protein
MNYKIIFTLTATVAGAITPPALNIFRHMFSGSASSTHLVYRLGLFEDS